MNPDKFKEGFCRWTSDRRLLKANASFYKIFGMSPLETGYPADVTSYLFREMCVAVESWLANRTGSIVEGYQLQLVRENGASLWLSINAERNAHSDEVIYEAYFRDITKLKEKESELVRQALYDHLTGLANRELFLDNIISATHEAHRRPSIKFAVISFDIRHFDDINRHYGRAFGDMLLRHVGQIIRSCCRENDTIGRTGTDVFTVLLRGIDTGGQIVNIIKRIRTTLLKPFSACGQTIQGIHGDVGVLFPMTDYTLPEAVLRDVEIATNMAKAGGGRSGCKFFSRKMLNESGHSLPLSIIMQNRRDMAGFYLDYQPIVKQTDGSLHSFEALARWNYDGGEIPPSVFIPIAEKTGFIKRLGSFVIENSCRQLRRWQDEFGAGIEIHVNISPYQLFLRSFPDDVRNILADTRVTASGLLFEVTESALLYDFDKVLRNMNAIRGLGVRFCLDDFGTGYSSLSYLKHLPIDYLKVDRAFILDVEKDMKTKKLLEHIVSIGKDMGYRLVVEGVESKEQLHLLRDFNLLIQGYFFHRPLAVAAARELLVAAYGRRIAGKHAGEDFPKTLMPNTQPAT
jgi:diguanylate cyclase (GGDEF)-like protein